MRSPPNGASYHHQIFYIRWLNMLGAAAILAFSTTIPLSEIAFMVLLLPYLVAFSKLNSQSVRASPT